MQKDSRTGQLDRRRKPAHLAVVRFRSGHSQASLAAAAGVARSTVAGLETGKRAPSLATATAIAGALGHDDPRVVFPDFNPSPPPAAA
ncbi:MAG: helix-turn-helix domain-containing protein [Actinomycetota bacterium]|nr:helix-turn-helix domain-containing protein [Actinomycetota bacterium]